MVFCCCLQICNLWVRFEFYWDCILHFILFRLISSTRNVTWVLLSFAILCILFDVIMFKRNQLKKLPIFKSICVHDLTIQFKKKKSTFLKPTAFIFLFRPVYRYILDSVDRKSLSLVHTHRPSERLPQQSQRSVQISLCEYDFNLFIERLSDYGELYGNEKRISRVHICRESVESYVRLFYQLFSTNNMVNGAIYRGWWEWTISVIRFRMWNIIIYIEYNCLFECAMNYLVVFVCVFCIYYIRTCYFGCEYDNEYTQ